MRKLSTSVCLRQDASNFDPVAFADNRIEMDADRRRDKAVTQGNGKRKELVMIQNAIRTGSLVYGTPRADSDVDLVVLMRIEDAQHLNELSDKPNLNENGVCSISVRGSSIRFGRLNLLIETDEGHFQDWVDGTAQLYLERPVTRDRAIAVFDVLRDARKEKESKK